MRPELAGEAALEAFEREVRLAASLTHPNTIQIYDYGYTGEGVFYYAMELVEGATLRRIVEDTGPLSAARTVFILTQAASALGEAHAKGIVHRDIKPTNIMLCERGGEGDFVKILDFGVARQIDLDRIERAELTVAGSAETLAPEALRGRAGPSSDLYALACVGYYCLTGQPLFSGESGQDVLRQHLTSRPVPPSRVHAGVPRDLESVILRGLSKDPAERAPDAAAFKRELMNLQSSTKWDAELAREWWTSHGSTLVGREVDDVTGSFVETQIRDSQELPESPK